MLVVESTNFNDWSWFDKRESFHSAAMTLVERFGFADTETITYQATITDPVVFTRPWSFTREFKRTHTDEKNYEFMEYACVEGERAINRIFGTAAGPPN